MNDPEPILLQRIASGETEAMAEYIQSRRGDLMAVILNKMGPALRARIEADDILQEVATTAVQSMDQLEFAERGPFGWLCEIAQRKVVDANRRFTASKRSAHGEVGIDAPRGNADAGIANLLIASITSPSRAFSRDQKEFAVRVAMEQLPEDQQRVLMLRYSEGKSSRDIAREIGKSDGATRVLLSRALSRLREVVGD